MRAATYLYEGHFDPSKKNKNWQFVEMSDEG